MHPLKPFKPQMSPKNGAIFIEGHVKGLSNTRALGEAGIPVYVLDTAECILRSQKLHLSHDKT